METGMSAEPTDITAEKPVPPFQPEHRPSIIKQCDVLLETLTSTAALLIGSLFALASMLVAIRNALHRSMDFQWSAAHLLLLHRDPWAVYLSGDRYHEFLLCQIPLYLHELYLLLLPFGFLSFAKAKLPWPCATFFSLSSSYGALLDCASLAGAQHGCCLCSLC